jgi:hypothetical protein
MPYIGNTPALDYISFAVQNFTVTAGTTVYTLDYSVSNENDIALYINSVAQRPGVSFAYSATGTTLTLTSATLVTDTMYAVFIGRAVQTVVPPASSITNTMLSPSVITGQTAETSVAGGDLVLVYDDSASALRKMTRTNFVSAAGDYVLLSTTTAAGTAAAIDITSNINSTFSIYRLSFFNVSAAGAGNTIFLRISDDGGSTFKSTGYLHTGLCMQYTGSVITQNDEASTGFVQISNNLPNFNDSATEGACGFIEFYTPSVSRKAVFTGMTAQIDDSGNGDAFYWGGVYTTAIIFNAIRIAASNNIYGTFKLYGLR